jgi:hypothetical protein
MARTSVLFVALLARQALVDALQTQQLFVSNYTAYPTCYRQPVLVVLDSQRIVVFIEGRNNTWCSGTSDGSPSSIRVRYTADGGTSWSAEAVLYTGGVDFLCSVYDPAKGRVHLFVQKGTATLYTTTDDGGGTFAPVSTLPVAAPNGFTYAQPSVAHGLALDGGLCADGTCGGKAGRLLVPFICHAKASAQSQPGDVACPGCYSCLLISDDGGKNWAIGAISTQDGTREASLIQLTSPPGSNAALIYASERNMGAVPGHKQHAVSSDSGDSFDLFGDDLGLPDGKTLNWTGVVSGATRVSDTLLVTTPMSTTQRQDLGLYTSRDMAATWNAGVMLRKGPAGYSDVAALNATHAAVVFENGDDDAAFDFAKRISFGIFDATNP